MCIEFLKKINWFEFLVVVATWLTFIFTFYYQYWKAFDPSARLNGRYKLSVNHIGNRVYQTAITFGMTFENLGAKTGYIEDVSLKLHNESKAYTYILLSAG